MSRLSIEITPEQHNAIKAMAFEYGVSIKDFVLNQLDFAKCKPVAKKPNSRLISALAEAAELEKEVKNGSKKPHKSTKDIFDGYR